MKELTKIVLESGIVDKTVAQLLQRWGSLTPEEYAQITHKQVVAESLEIFIEELELLLQPEALERGVTRLDQPSASEERK